MIYLMTAINTIVPQIRSNDVFHLRFVLDFSFSDSTLVLVLISHSSVMTSTIFSACSSFMPESFNNLTALRNLSWFVDILITSYTYISIF